MGAFQPGKTVVRRENRGVRQTRSEPYTLPFHWCKFEPLFYTLWASALLSEEILTAPCRGLKVGSFTHLYETMNFTSNVYRGGHGR